ncbi:MAG TPA: hypothetical protein VKT33_00530 [Candidatus Angelobacter sp.]|nr:hypothetical protein [Candidatus Angelobacter sp.]
MKQPLNPGHYFVVLNKFTAIKLNQPFGYLLPEPLIVVQPACDDLLNELIRIASSL